MSAPLIPPDDSAPTLRRHALVGAGRVVALVALVWAAGASAQEPTRTATLLATVPGTTADRIVWGQIEGEANVSWGTEWHFYVNFEYAFTVPLFSATMIGYAGFPRMEVFQASVPALPIGATLTGYTCHGPAIIDAAGPPRGTCSDISNTLVVPPANTQTPTLTQTATHTATRTPSETATRTGTHTPTRSQTATGTPSRTATRTDTATAVPTMTPSRTRTDTATAIPTNTPRPTPGKPYIFMLDHSGEVPVTVQVRTFTPVPPTP